MAMSGGDGTKSALSEIDATPLIDVLLVFKKSRHPVSGARR